MSLTIRNTLFFVLAFFLVLSGSSQPLEKALAPGWNLVSPPVRLGTNTLALKLFEGGVAQNSPQPTLRFSASRYVGITAVSPSVLTPGEGHWVWAEAGWILKVDGGEPNLANPTLAALMPGWNLVGNPFETPLPRNMVFQNWANGATPSPFLGDWYVWENGDYHTTDTLSPWQGAWVLAAQESQLAAFSGYLFSPKEHTRALLSWGASTDPNVAGYNIYKDGVKVNDGVETATSYMVGHLGAGEAHSFQIKAVDAQSQESDLNSPMTSTTFPVTQGNTGVIGGRVMKVKTPNPLAFSSSTILEPVASASVTLSGTGQTTVTDAWGYFEFSQVSPGSHSLVSEDARFGFARGAVEVEAGKSVDAGEMVYIQPTRLATGRAHACAVRADGTVRCWGWNGFGQLGNGIPLGESGVALNSEGQEDEAFWSTTPVEVVGLSDVVSIGAGYFHTCALRRDGALYCWGRTFGALGNGTLSSSSVPLLVPGLTNIVSFDLGQMHICAVKAGGMPVCWGVNEDGQLGDNSKINRSTPVPVYDTFGVISISGGEEHTCANLSDGRVKCWGNRFSGQIGDGVFGISLGDSQTTPVYVISLPKSVSISAGDFHSCSLNLKGEIRCWGLNVTAQLGDGTRENKSSPSHITNFETHSALGLGSSHSCAATANKELKCWGRNEYGQLGNGSPSQNLNQGIVDVLGLDNILAVSGGGLFTCAMKNDFSVFCWGYNEFGRLGIGNLPEQSIPVQVILD